MTFCLETVALPIIDGSISTLLGIVMLGASKFAFVRKYFFLPYVIIVLIGAFNGLVVLPVALSVSWDMVVGFTGRGRRGDNGTGLLDGSNHGNIASVHPLNGGDDDEDEGGKKTQGDEVK